MPLELLDIIVNVLLGPMCLSETDESLKQLWAFHRAARPAGGVETSQLGKRTGLAVPTQ